jgi:hypothetical protein
MLNRLAFVKGNCGVIACGLPLRQEARMRYVVSLVVILSAALGFEESFSGNIFPVDNWTWANADSGERNWQRLDRDFRTEPGCALCRRDTGGIRSFDWLIAPQCTVSAGDSFSFWCRAVDAAHRESVEVWVSTASPHHEDFQLLDAFGTNSTTYELRGYRLTPYAGQMVFLAIVYRSQMQSGVLIDDVLGPATWRPFTDVGVKGYTGESHLDHRYGDSLGEIPFILQNWGRQYATFDADFFLMDSSGTVIYNQLLTIIGVPPGETVVVSIPFFIQPWCGVQCSTVMSSDQRPWNNSLGPVVYRAYRFTPRGGPDSSGYYWYDSGDSAGPDYDWLELCPTGTRLGGGNDTVFQLNLPWPFRFYGQDCSTAYVSTDGWLSFNPQTGSADSNTAIPSPAGPNCVVAPFWDDLYSQGNEAGIWYQQASDSLFVIEWHDFGRDGAWRCSLNFEVKLFRSGAIEFHYNRVVVEAGRFHLNRVEVCEGRFDQGQSATVGIENELGTVGLQYLHNGAPAGNYLQAGRAIRVQPWQGGGVEERITPDASRITPKATVVRGVLWVSAGTVPERGLSQAPEGLGYSQRSDSPLALLLDASGRKVADLRPGPNDVSRLSPGVYFVRSEPSAVSREPSAVIKVVITR